MADTAGAPDIGFRPVTEADLPMLADWLARPHWRAWWGDPETELGYIRDMIEGRDTTSPWIFTLDGADAGYIQMWRIADNRVEPWLSQAPWMTELPDDAVGVDLSLADGESLGRGTGTRVLSRFTERLRAEGFTNIIIDPDPANLRAVRAYARAGFRPIPELQGRTGDSLILRHIKD
ncbi:GNAT family N-acetyltransferase [Oceaniglobus roseus]|uniref:GNAT family N-acetyltransferase n=1 Tax=Oceaniglobus roseus TaxID=1737570 RepID=UPI001C12A236|nr:GNAT family N-acetyltransferase [Kandeliimicrobium roseum]